MKLTCAMLVPLAIAASSYASFIPRDVSFCAGAETVSTTSILAENGNVVELAMLSCDAAAAAAAAAPVPADIPSTTAAPAPAPTDDVCGELCTNVCADSGVLPPTSEDCQTIVSAITILNGSVDPSFEVDPSHAQTLTFGTCRFYFENLSVEPMSYCWLAFAQVASAAAATCLPPVQPINSEGFCLSPSGLWLVGVAHA